MDVAAHHEGAVLDAAARAALEAIRLVGVRGEGFSVGVRVGVRVRVGVKVGVRVRVRFEAWGVASPACCGCAAGSSSSSTARAVAS